MALLSKSTWIIMFGILPVIAVVDVLFGFSRCRIRTYVSQRGLILILGIMVLNVGYRFDGSFRRLDSFEFHSHTLKGTVGDNRFRDHLVGSIRVPLPQHFVLGIDEQKTDFESRFPSYLLGQWKQGGWWYYYIVGAVTKSPCGLVALFAMNCLLCIGSKTCRPPIDELRALIFGIAVFILVSSQTGFSHHLRYALPAFPYAFVFCSRVFRTAHAASLWLRLIAGGLVGLSAIESVVAFPNSPGFFNCVAGGTGNGHKIMLDSNVDWGQDLFMLRDWQRAHPEADPMKVLTYGILDVQPLGVTSAGYPPSSAVPTSAQKPIDLCAVGPLPGWYAISVTALHWHEHPDKGLLIKAGVPMCDYFNQFEPVARLGSSILVYCLKDEDVVRVRTSLGLPICTADDQK